MEPANIRAFIGQVVELRIDRPLGSRHPERDYIYYPVNYGFVPNVLAQDGENLDAYVLGVFEPLENFTGQCIAIIHRLDDNDNKLVVTPAEKTYTDEQIIALTEFQERFHKSVILR